jgi:hypothetical protein
MFREKGTLMSDEKRTEEKKPIEDKSLDQVSGGYIIANPISTKVPRQDFPTKPGRPQPD